MRCEHCLFDDDKKRLPIVEVLDGLASCESCELLDPGNAPPTFQNALLRLREAGSVVRKLRSANKQREEDLKLLKAEMIKYETKVADLERLHRKSTMELEAQIAIANKQAEEIRALSAPTLEIEEGVLALPIIGVLDDERARAMTEILLNEVTRVSPRFIVLDLTGLELVDEDTGSRLLRMLSAVKLLGVEVMISGMRGAVAATLVRLGGDLSALSSVRTVKEALRRCRIGVDIVARITPGLSR